MRSTLLFYGVRSRTISNGCQRDYPLITAGAVAVAERAGQLLLELTRRGELLDDVRPADQLAAHEDLRDRRPAGDCRELLAVPRVGQDVDGRDGRARRPQRLERALG